MANINETIAEVEKINPELARQIKKYVKSHSYGLVYENNLPESVRLYKKTPAVGDTVNILPERGRKEAEENRVAWVVKKILGDVARIYREDEEKDVPVCDIVPLVSYHDVIYPGLKEIDRIERGNPEDPYHVVINAENYHALEALNYCYAGKVDCIYIDPPYNKPNAKDWKYNCNYIDANDRYRHSKWLSFMERRLKLAKQLLNPDDSVLIVTIDEVEYARLALLLEQTFPDARIQMVTTVIKPEGTQRVNEFSRTNEFIFFVIFGDAVVYPWKDMTNSDDTISTLNEKLPYRNFRRTNSANVRSSRPNQFYPVFVNVETGKIHSVGAVMTPDVKQSDIVCPEGTKAIFPLRDSGEEMIWYKTPESLKKLIEKGYAYAQTKKGVTTIQYLSSGIEADIESGKIVITGRTDEGELLGHYAELKTTMPKSVWTMKSHGSREYGSVLIKDVYGGESRFSFPKSVYAVKDCIRLVMPKKDALIVDFFAGSGTTLHAVNLLNAEDGGHRRCICVTNNEVSESEEKEFIKAGLRPSDPDWEKYGIANYVTWPRTKCSIEGVDINGNPLLGNYGCEIDVYQEYEGNVIDSETGNKVRGTVYKKVKKPLYPELAKINMSDGFSANAIFCELTYESAWPIRLDNAFDAIAPILWMQAGCRGPIIKRIGKRYLTTDYYGVLFDYNQSSKFCEKVKATPSIKTVFIVTDDQRRFSNMCKRLPGITVNRLYETYLRTFEICGEGGLD